VLPCSIFTLYSGTPSPTTDSVRLWNIGHVAINWQPHLKKPGICLMRIQMKCVFVFRVSYLNTYSKTPLLRPPLGLYSGVVLLLR